MVIGATVTKDAQGRAYENYVYQGAPNFCAVPNPHRRSETAGDDDYMSEDEDDLEKPIEYTLMPTKQATIKFSHNTLGTVLDHHARKVTGSPPPDWCNPASTHFPATQYAVFEPGTGDSSAVTEVHVLRNVSVAWSIARFMECSEGDVEHLHDDEWVVLPPELTSADVETDRAIRVAVRTS